MISFNKKDWFRIKKKTVETEKWSEANSLKGGPRLTLFSRKSSSRTSRKARGFKKILGKPNVVDRNLDKISKLAHFAVLIEDTFGYRLGLVDFTERWLQVDTEDQFVQFQGHRFFFWVLLSIFESEGPIF